MSVPLSSLTPAQCFAPTLKRELVAFQDPEAPKSHLDIYHANSIADPALNDLKFKKRDPTVEEIAIYSDRKQLIRSMRDGIESHFDRRVELFFQQAILCHRTPFIYDAGSAEDQIGKGGDFKLTRHLTHHSRAAHSSTLPCLYASPKLPDGTARVDQRFVFLKHSHAYNQHNATVELPIEVNNADCVLDGTSTQNRLRTKTLTLINSLARGEIDPTRATKQFLKLMERELGKQIAELAQTDLRRRVLKVYLTRLSEVKEGIKHSPEIFDQIMGVKLEEAEGVQQLREIVYKRRYTLIQESASLESQIAKRIFLSQRTMLRSRVNSLSKIDYRLRYALLSTAQRQERRLYEKLFCTSLDQLNAKLDAAARASLSRKVEQFQTTHSAELTNLRRDLRLLRNTMVKLELTYRSQLFRGLRCDLKRLYQWEFAAEFSKKYPTEAMSQAMVSRLEQPGRALNNILYRTPIAQRRKEMDIPKAEKIADTFGIDVGLFLPGLIASE